MPPKKDRHAQLDQCNFYCKNCLSRFEGVPSQIIPSDWEYHPFEYLATCPNCGKTAEWATWERHLFKLWAKSTGPTTTEGKAKVSKNLIGHPTPEEAQRTRFNAMRHGLTARVAMYFPAKPGSYPHCNNCQWLHNGCGDWAHNACLTRTELFLKHQVAFQTKDPTLLTELRSDAQAGITAIMHDMILAIARSGVQLESPEWYSDKDGNFHLAQYIDAKTGNLRQITKIQSHPLLKPLFDLLQKNNLSLADMDMTPKAKGDDEIVKGFLDGQQRGIESLENYASQQAKSFGELKALIERGRSRVAVDPVLIEHKAQNGGDNE